jgi:hypothetical protein
MNTLPDFIALARAFMEAQDGFFNMGYPAKAQMNQASLALIQAIRDTAGRRLELIEWHPPEAPIAPEEGEFQHVILRVEFKDGERAYFVGSYTLQDGAYINDAGFSPNEFGRVLEWAKFPRGTV